LSKFLVFLIASAYVAKTITDISLSNIENEAHKLKDEVDKV